MAPNGAPRIIYFKQQLVSKFGLVDIHLYMVYMCCYSRYATTKLDTYMSADIFRQQLWD